MIIPTTDYKIIRTNVPVLTRTDDGNYINTACWLNDFDTESETLKNLLSGFNYKGNIMDSIVQYGHSPIYSPVLRILTTPNLRTVDFDAAHDILAIALFLDKGKNNPTWLHFFEVNGNYRRHATKNQKYKRIGESAIKSLQQEYMHQGIKGRSTPDALNFYYKYGFKKIDDFELYLRWDPER